MNNKKAEEEVSALITGVMLLGLVAPALLLWFAGRYYEVSNYLVDVGVLEQSERVIIQLHEETGLDLGRIMIVGGLSLLILVISGNLYTCYYKKK